MSVGVEDRTLVERAWAAPPPDDRTIGVFVRAFVDGGADYITLDGWSRPAQWADVRWAEKVGLLRACEATSRANSDDQYTAACFRLVDPTRAELGKLAEAMVA